MKTHIFQIVLIFLIGTAVSAVHFSLLKKETKINVLFTDVQSLTSDMSSDTGEKETEESGDAKTVEIKIINLKRAKTLYENGEAQFVDVRAEEKFTQAHIPGAVHLPVSAFAHGWPVGYRRTYSRNHGRSLLR